MLKNRKHDHIGLATDDIDATVAWYTEVLGFELYGECIAPDGTPCKFLRGNGINYEVFQPVSGVGESSTIFRSFPTTSKRITNTA